MNDPSIRKRLFDAVALAAPACSQVFTNVHEGSPKRESAETKPSSPVTPIASRQSSRDEPPTPRGRCSQTFTDVHECSSKPRSNETNPTPPPGARLTARQVAAARVLALGHSGCAAAAEVGVEKHTITRWRRTPAFAAEVERQQALVLAEHVRQRRAEAVDAYAATAERIARKYGMAR
jgi:hypothetical protein